MSLMVLKDLRMTPNKNDLNNLIEQVQPSWPLNDVVVKELSGGYSNKMYLCSRKNGETLRPIAIRIRNIFENSPLCNHEFETKVLENLYARNLFPKIYATFQNGYAYEYAEGEPLASSEVTTMNISDHTLRLIAAKLSLIHSVTITETNYRSESWFSRLKKFVESSYPEKPAGEGIEHVTRAKVLKEINSIESKVEEFAAPFVLCQGDCHSANMIYSQKKDDIVIVDYEWTHVGYQAEDIAFYLQLLDISELTFDLNISVPLNHERKFLAYYLESWYRKKNPKYIVADDDIDRLQKQVKLFRLLCTLFIIICHVVLPNFRNSVKNDRAEIIRNLLALYSRSRQGILGNSSCYF